MYKSRKNGMVQSGVWLSVPMHEALQAAGGPRKVGVEIRKRLEEWQIFHDQGYRVTARPMVFKVEE